MESENQFAEYQRYLEVCLDMVLTALGTGSISNEEELKETVYMVCRFESCEEGFIFILKNAPVIWNEMVPKEFFEHFQYNIKKIIHATCDSIVANDVYALLMNTDGYRFLTKGSQSKNIKVMKGKKPIKLREHWICAVKQYQDSDLLETFNYDNQILSIYQNESEKRYIYFLDHHDIALVWKGYSQIIALYDLVAEEKEIIFEKQLEQRLSIKADKSRLKQLLANLVDNAIKYSPSGGKVTLKAYQKTESIIIEICDQGMGINNDELELIFDRLYRADKSRSRKGLGLGLSIVKAIVQAHRGKIEVESKMGKGSDFRVIVPYGLNLRD